MDARDTPRRVNQLDILQTLTLLHEPGDVVEARILTADWKTGTLSGYFTEPEQLSKAVTRWSGKAAIYITLNPCNPALFARSAQRLTERAKQTTADHDITRRAWLPIDFDPVRPAGISSTDAQHEAAIARMQACHRWLQEQGCPAGIEANSGNGAHLLCRIDLPNTDESRSLVQRCLEGLASRFSDDEVSLDLTTYNAARIWKLYGTMACKGDDLPERPHRLAGILCAPEKILPCPLAQLDAFAAPRTRTDGHQAGAQNGHGSGFDLGRWIVESHLELIGPKSWKAGGRKWVFPVCPWNAEHTNGSAFITQQANGAIDAGCHHNSCHGKDWHALRDLVEPGWRERRQSRQTSSDRNHHQQDSEQEGEVNITPWPALDPLALHGLAGDIVRTVGPHTEADDVALLIQTLLAFGNAIRRRPHCMAEADYHALNEFAILVGNTSKGRKGTSAGHIRRLFYRVDPEWVTNRLQAGLSSGEGLIWAVRDPIVKTEAIREKGRPTGEYRDVVADVGVDDKRLLVLEAEFASTLRVLGRDGNTLSAIIRQAWDDGTLRVLTKNTPAVATGAHISIVGHITKDELLRYLESTEAGNGFGNRFLWCCVRRSKSLPEGGSLQDAELNTLVVRLRHAIDAARTVDVITRDSHAKALWREVYAELSEDKPGLLGAMTSRAEAHVLRLSAIYALLDETPIVTPNHLLAALALWKYAEDSARFIFGDALGDPTADEILTQLRATPEGMTRTDLYKHFDCNKPAAEILRALRVLASHGLVSMEKITTTGRPTERWNAL